MSSISCITSRTSFWRLTIVIAFLACCHSIVWAQKVAVLVPEPGAEANVIAEQLARSFPAPVTIIDASLADSAFRSMKIEHPFNLTLEESKRLGSVIGCDTFVMVRSETLRRTSSAKPSYFESFAAIYAASTRTGHLVWWGLKNAEDDASDAAAKRLSDVIEKDSGRISNEIAMSIAKDVKDPETGFAEMPAEGSPEAKNFRAPVPYLRIKPEYTSQAYLYDAKGTIEVFVDLDEKGMIVATEITRWGGFGLEDAVLTAVRKMNWRPGERSGKPLPTRFLLRYNFKKIEKEQ